MILGFWLLIYEFPGRGSLSWLWIRLQRYPSLSVVAGSHEPLYPRCLPCRITHDFARAQINDRLSLGVTLRYEALAGGEHPLRFAVCAILPYAETVPDGGRQGSRRHDRRSPHRLAA